MFMSFNPEDGSMAPPNAEQAAWVSSLLFISKITVKK